MRIAMKFLTACILAAGAMSSALAQSGNSQYEAIVENVHGLVTARINGVVTNVVPGMRLPQNAQVTTTPGSSLRLATPNKLEGGGQCRVAMAGGQNWIAEREPSCCPLNEKVKDLNPAADQNREMVIERVEGTAIVVRDGKAWPAKPGMKLEASDQVVTTAGSSLTLFTARGCMLSLAQSMSLQMDSTKNCCQLYAGLENIEAAAEKALAGLPVGGLLAADKILFGVVSGWTIYKSLSGH
jgi:hypothetical protein